jgi:hypothetical protein
VAQYDLDNPHAARAIGIAACQLAESPTPEGLAQLARTYILGRDDRSALEVVERGLALWPDHVQLLMMGARAARRSGADAAHAAYLRRLEPFASADAKVQSLLMRARGATAEERAHEEAL